MPSPSPETLNTPRYSCVTDYHSLYAQNYFAHDTQSTSFDLVSVPEMVASMAQDRGKALLDLGGGNGVLAAVLRDRGLNAFTVDAADWEQPHYARYDLASHDPEAVDMLLSRLRAPLGPNWIVTCLDVAEHIDREHLADFLLNLRHLTTCDCIISISTRPSSMGNRFHCSVLPISTWQKMLSLAGFEVVAANLFAAVNQGHRFRGDTEQIGAVAHWERVNPFRDANAHQHYLHIRPNAAPPGLQELRDSIAGLVDTRYRNVKRGAITAPFPPTFFNVNFIQDWSFVRTIMDVYPAGRLHLLFREDCIAPQYLHLLRNYCERTSTPYGVMGTVMDGFSALSDWGCGTNSLFISATEGLPSPTHAMNALVACEAGRMGATTLSLQHGVNISRAFSSSCDIVGTWDQKTANRLLDQMDAEGDPAVYAVGNAKFLDALMPPGGGGLSARLGDWTRAFEAVYLIGLNLHWKAHEHGESATYEWVRRTIESNANCLFILRPHPDDHSIYAMADLLQSPNILLLDDMTLLAMDVSISRLMHEVDGVISTNSSLHIDAMAAGKPTVMLPAQPGLAELAGLLDNSWPTGTGSAPETISANDWLTGELPNALSIPAEVNSEWFVPSYETLQTLATLAPHPKRPSDIVERTTSNLVVAGNRQLSFNRHPHQDMVLLSAALGAFVGG
jgi:2-polyprenyl-3-methyl-5-hydroxy-6-metoxy-1,4-benzoquinol methylase